MTITIIVRKKEHTLEKETSVMRAMELLEVSPQAHLAVREGKLLTEDDRLYHGDVVKFVSVISGG